jgi:hypothetical protein
VRRPHDHGPVAAACGRRHTPRGIRTPSVWERCSSKACRASTTVVKRRSATIALAPRAAWGDRSCRGSPLWYSLPSGRSTRPGLPGDTSPSRHPPLCCRKRLSTLALSLIQVFSTRQRVLEKCSDDTRRGPDTHRERKKSPEVLCRRHTRHEQTWNIALKVFVQYGIAITGLQS